MALYTLAAQPRSLITVEMVPVVVFKSSLFGIVSGALAAAVVRRHPVAMVLVSQVLIMLILIFVWNR